MRKLHFISCVEDLPRFVWETAVQLNNMRKYGYSDKFRVIVFLPAYRLDRGISPQWKTLEEFFPETQFFYYPDENKKITQLAANYDYIPIHRLCSLERHFREHPQLEKDAIFYLDSDVIFLKQPELDQWLDDDINYLSDTKTYLNLAYLDSKVKDVRPDRQEEYKRVDIVGKGLELARLTRKIAYENNESTGGAQYLLKNINWKFFAQCVDLCLMIREHFRIGNQYFFPGATVQEREDKGIQSWCADMWAIQWNLWRLGLPCQTPQFMDFAWATDRVTSIQEQKPHIFMLHNAGITGDAKIRITENNKSVRDEENKPVLLEAPAFFKDSYKTKSVFTDIPTLEYIANHELTSQYYTSIYTREILDTYNTLLKPQNNGQH